jgi:cytochrome c oxidase assembly factor CtaG
MNPQARIGLVTTMLTFVAGIWMFLAPFIMEYQRVGEDWIDATRNDMWTGGILMAVSTLAFFLFVAYALRDAAARAEEHRREDEGSQSSG